MSESELRATLEMGVGLMFGGFVLVSVAGTDWRKNSRYPARRKWLIVWFVAGAILICAGLWMLIVEPWL